MNQYSPENGLRCPDCRHNGLNRLADGRCQCKRCRKKFTPRQRKSRLPGKVLWEIARSFWLMAPAARGCDSLGLNRKTVQRYYLILRLRITKDRERALLELFGNFTPDTSPFGGCSPAGPGQSGQGRHPVFGIITRGREAWVLFPEQGGRHGTPVETVTDALAPDYWVYARGPGAYEKKDIDRFSCLPATGREEFWLFAKRRLRKYYGGFKRNFPLFIREMEFRFNHRDDADPVAHLLSLLPHGPE